MIDALISGPIRSAVNQRTTNGGKPFASWRMAATDKNGDSVLCSCIAFSEPVVEAIQRLGAGDTIAVTGEVAVSIWEASDGTIRHGLDVLVHGVISAYHMGRKRPSATG